ncbi:MAG: CBS domain-containing protein [Myxococcales bacterium]|nr:CBS domain-containing protein [Myxococcales bacterium]
MTATQLRVADVMTRELVTVTDTTTVSEAQRKMRQSNVRHLPVVDEAERLIGILSDRDLLGALSAGVEALVGWIMTPRLKRVQLDTPAHEAARLMIAHTVGALPVVDAKGTLVGLVTETDFLRIAHQVLCEVPVIGRG